MQLRGCVGHCSNTVLQVNDDAAYSDNETVTQKNNVTLANARKANGGNGCNGVTLPPSSEGVSVSFVKTQVTTHA